MSDTPVGDTLDQRIRSVLAEVFDLDAEVIGSDTSIDTVEGWDSLQHLTLVLALEEEFGVHFDEEETLSLVSYPLITAIIGDRVDNDGRS